MDDAENAALGDASRLADGQERNGDIDRLVELHLDEIDVLEVPLHRVQREVANHGEELLAVERELEHRVLPEFAPQDRRDLFGRHGDRGRRETLAVSDRGNEPASTQSASLGLSSGDAGLGLKGGHAGYGHMGSDHLSALAARAGRRA